MSALTPSTVIPGLVPGIHVFATLWFQDVDGRDKPGHDANETWCACVEGRAH
jgi:hypothetical protein